MKQIKSSIRTIPKKISYQREQLCNKEIKNTETTKKETQKHNRKDDTSVK